MTILFNIFRQLMEWLGLLKSESQRIDDKIKHYEQKLDLQQVRLRDLKYEIESIEAEIKYKEKELKKPQQSQFNIETLRGEIAILFKNLDLKSNQRDLIFRNIESIDIAVSKYKELKLAVETGLDEDELKDLRDNLSILVKELESQDKRIKELENVGYKPKSDVLSGFEQKKDVLENHSDVQPLELQKNSDANITATANSETNSDRQSEIID